MSTHFVFNNSCVKNIKNGESVNIWGYVGNKLLPHQIQPDLLVIKHINLL